MKITVICLLNIFLVSVQCSKSNDEDLSFMKTLEGLKITNSPLSFSFNKKDYSGFKCNFNDEILIHESLIKPPFYHSISIRNFFSVFCYIFQYSAIIYDKEFRKIIESLFEYYLERVHELRNPSDKFIYNPLDFKNHLVKMENKICELISGEDYDNLFVNVEENEERVIITPKESSKICYLNIIEECVKDLPPVDSDQKIDDAMIEFYIKYGEAYLQDQLPEGYLETLIKFSKQLKNDENCGQSTQVNDSIVELSKKFKFINDLTAGKKNTVQKTNDGDLKEYCKEEFTSSFLKYSKIFARKYFSGELPAYYAELISKTKTKALFALSKDCKFLDYFSLCKKEYVDSCLSLKDMLFEMFKDPKKIDYGFKKLSDESIESLVKNCLDMDI